MMKPLALLTSVLLGAVACLPALAQTPKVGGEIAAPDYGSGSGSLLANGSFNTPASDGRPGLYYFGLGVEAFKNGDYRHAVDMYKVAASWAYKPAEYNLGLMYFKGQGVATDRARGAAWMVLAAERGNPLYVKARDLMITALSKAEFQQTDEYWGQMAKTYGDKVALRRAKGQWNSAGSQETGTHIAGGIPGYLRVGEAAQSGPIGTKIMPTTAAAVLSGGSVDGSLAYQQFRQSTNPYDPIFVKNRTGTATVGPLEQVKPGNDKQPPSKKKDNSASPQPPRNA